MATSVIEICNLALDMLGAGPITSLDDNLKTASLCKRNYPLARDAALRAYPWGCAKARTTLAAIVGYPSWQFGASYQLPVDCLRVLEVDGDVAGDIRWRVEGRTLVVEGTGAVNVLYIKQVVDPNDFDALLVQAMAARLAGQIAYAVTGNRNLSVDMLTAAQAFEAEARRIAAREQSQDNEVEADLWSGARYTSYGLRGSTNLPAT